MKGHELVKDIACRFLKEIKEAPKNRLEVDAIANPEPKGEEDKYLLSGKLHTSEEVYTEDTDAEVSIKALRQRGRYTKEDHDYKGQQPS